MTMKLPMFFRVPSSRLQGQAVGFRSTGHHELDERLQALPLKSVAAQTCSGLKQLQAMLKRMMTALGLNADSKLDQLLIAPVISELLDQSSSRGYNVEVVAVMKTVQEAVMAMNNVLRGTGFALFGRVMEELDAILAESEKQSKIIIWRKFRRHNRSAQKQMWTVMNQMMQLASQHCDAVLRVIVDHMKSNSSQFPPLQTQSKPAYRDEVIRTLTGSNISISSADAKTTTSATLIAFEQLPPLVKVVGENGSFKGVTLCLENSTTVSVRVWVSKTNAKLPEALDVNDAKYDRNGLDEDSWKVRPEPFEIAQEKENRMVLAFQHADYTQEQHQRGVHIIIPVDDDEDDADTEPRVTETQTSTKSANTIVVEIDETEEKFPIDASRKAVSVSIVIESVLWDESNRTEHSSGGFIKHKIRSRTRYVARKIRGWAANIRRTFTPCCINA